MPTLAGISLIFLLYLVNKSVLSIEAHRYVNFLLAVHDYYKSSGILLLHADNFSDRFHEERSIGQYLRQFSDNGTMCQSLVYSQLDGSSSNSDRLLSRRSLYVVFLPSVESFADFSRLTETQDMSCHTWLVVFSGQGANDECLDGPRGNPFNLVFDTRMMVVCHGSSVVQKWYSLSRTRNRTRSLEVANWIDSPGRLSFKDDSDYYDYRYNLAGSTVRIATPTRQSRSANGKMSGYLESVLRELSGLMSFRVEHSIEEDAVGIWDSRSRSWSGIIGHLTRGQVDLGLAPVTISKFRLDYVEFTRPLLLSANRIYLRQPAAYRVPWSAYFRAFSVKSWIAIVLVLLAASIISAFVRFILDRDNGASRPLNFSLSYALDNFIRIWGIYCQQGLSEFPMATPLRFAYFSTLLLTVIIWAIFSASITSFLTILEPSLSFSDVDGFVRDGSYQLIVVQNSSDQYSIVNGVDPILLKLRPFLKDPDYLPSNAFAGFQQVCDGKIGFYSSSAALKGVSAYIPCALSYIETGQSECLAIALPKRSPYVTSMNYYLRKLEDSGVLKKLAHSFFVENSELSFPSHSPIGIRGIAPLLTIYTTGVCLAFAVLTAERLHRLFVLKLNERHGKI
ncbi:hypothetical protein TKK_0018133 [Trichogramma kaykai]|uniref:Ionotropic glutamate receptor C-terminal domain-containing protein n=1 Tax=Trichogramma kaykai TaxID=54128 RepID=A0ABD2W0C9_9HYME